MNIDLIKLGQKIKFERIKRNISQEQLAELSNLSIHGISNIETRSEERRVGKECRSRWSPYH